MPPGQWLFGGFYLGWCLAECNIALEQKDVGTVSSIEQCQG